MAQIASVVSFACITYSAFCCILLAQVFDFVHVIAVFFQMQLVITKRADKASHHCNSRCEVSPASPARTVSHLYASQQAAYHPGFAKLPSSAKRRIAVAVEPQSLLLR